MYLTLHNVGGLISLGQSAQTHTDLFLDEEVPVRRASPVVVLSSLFAFSLSSSLCSRLAYADEVVEHPTKLVLDAQAFEQPGTERSTLDGIEDKVEVLDHESFRTADGKFDAGVYAVAGPHRFEVKDGYGVDEFFYFLEGGVTLTSVDGKRTEVGAGEAVVIPKGWRGTWESPGYKKIYVIRSDEPIE